MPEYNQLILGSVRSAGFLRATFSGRQRLAKSDVTRVTVRMVEVQGEARLQVSRFTARQDFTSNHPLSEAAVALADVLATGFANVHLSTSMEEIDVRLTKKLDVQVGRKKRAAEALAMPEPHNRVKEVPLPEGKADRILQMMGIMAADGKIRPTMRGKFTQINRFLELLEPLLPEVSTEKPLQILDAGCGSAYLTIATHHYLNEIRGIRASVMGVDLNEGLIEKSTSLTESLSNISFLNARIGELENVRPDIVLALHACDTATDDAIAQAIRSGAKLFLGAPCCHKNLNARLRAEVLAPIHRHGILHQRLADLATDAFRAQVLRIMGYKADVIEFVSPEHTAKNLMIRAVRIEGRNVCDAKVFDEYGAMKRFFGVTPYLETALGALFPTSAATAR